MNSNSNVCTLEFLKRLRDPRMPRYGGHEFKGAGVGMGRFLLGLTAYAVKRHKGRVVIVNEAY